jgi:hypothetical protein
MLQRLIVRDNESPDAARRRFDAQLSVKHWGTPVQEMTQAEPAGKAAPWWWDEEEAARSSDFFMEMARSKGMV